MPESGVKIACAAASVTMGILGCAPAEAAPIGMRYACEGRQNLVVERDRSTARVTFIDRTYVLRRAPSSIGVKYLAPNAALIIDGGSAVFVADDRLQLGACNAAFPVAAAQ